MPAAANSQSGLNRVQYATAAVASVMATAVKLVSAARALAICHHVVARSTPARIAGIEALGLGAGRDLDAMLDAQALFLDLILAQQLVDMQHGRPPTNAVVVKSLSERDKDRLRAALRSIEHIDALVRDLLFNRR